MMRRVLLSLILGVGIFTSGAAAESVTIVGFEITFPDGTKAQMTVTNAHFVPLELPSGSAGLFLTVNPADHNAVAVVFYSVKFTGNDLLESGPLTREQTRTELGRDIAKVGGEAIQSKTSPAFRIRVTKVVHQER
jgi:hypothetical protein